MTDEAAVNSNPSKSGRSVVKSVISNILKKTIIAIFAYSVFYFEFSLAWIFALIILAALREEQKKENEKKHNIKRIAHLVDEKDAIKARLKELPSWVVFPDVDRAEWLNKIIKKIWPHVNLYFIKILRGPVQGNINKKFESFKFEEIELGCAPPRIDGIKVYEEINRNEIIVDFDVFYAGDCDINFSVYGTGGCIRDLEMDVLMRVVLKPFIFKMPLIGGLQIFFLNNPEIDFSLEGIANIPGFGHYIKKKIVKQLAKKMVFPNKIAIKLSKSLDSAELKWLEPEGVLRIHIIEARDLERKDVNVLGIGKSDPYAVLTLGSQEYKTQVVNNTTEPKWDSWCEFSILDTSAQHLNIEVFDEDYKSHDFLGSATVNILSIVKEGKRDIWIDLIRAKHGKIHLRFNWLTLSADYSDLKAATEETKSLQVKDMSTAVLAVYIYSATNIPEAKHNRKPDPYLVLTVGRVSRTSKTKKHTVNPKWEQGFAFLIANPESDSLYLTIKDKYTENMLDQLIYPIHNLIEEECLEINRLELNLSKCDGTITLSLQLRILKSGDEISSEEEEDSSSDYTVSRENSMQSNKSKSSDVAEFISNENRRSVEGTIDKVSVSNTSRNPTTTEHRNASFSLSGGQYGLGRLQLTLRYSMQRQKLVIIVHKLANLPLKDPSNIPDPYVKVQLLPQSSSNEKHKTRVIMDNCNPVFDETFEYLVSEAELHRHQLVFTVKSKTTFSLSNHFMGEVVINIAQINLSQPLNSWFDLTPESSHD